MAPTPYLACRRRRSLNTRYRRHPRAGNNGAGAYRPGGVLNVRPKPTTRATCDLYSNGHRFALPIVASPAAGAQVPLVLGLDGMDPATMGRMLTQKLVAAEAGLRTGQIDAVSEDGQSRRSTARLIFDLGDTHTPPRLYFLSTYQSGKSSQTVERISIGEHTWERQSSGAWLAIGSQEGPWGQVQAFMPQPAAITDPSGARDSTSAALSWYDSGLDADSVLQFDLTTGVLQNWKQRTRSTGTTLTLRYTSWNTPVHIPTPDK